MASVSDLQQETLATIDAAKAIIDIDKLIVLFGFLFTNQTFQMSYSLDFILKLLKSLGITRDELKSWLVNFLTLVLPALEISVKGILLTNLKNMVSCSIDPRIPEKYRKAHKSYSNYETSQENGIDISLESIDFLSKLTINPLSDEGKGFYFGLDNIDDVYKFARADDFDAFLWFVMHKGHFPNSDKITELNDLSSRTASTSDFSIAGDSLLDTVTVNCAKGTSILVGNTFSYSSGHVISMCVDARYDSGNTIVENTLVPISDDWSSVNWYVRRSDQLGKNLGFGWNTSRDFSKEVGICNLQFIDQASSDGPITGLVNNKFRFTILPKPYIDYTKEIPRKMLFDSKGNYDPNGKFTVSGSSSIITTGSTIKADPKDLYECYKGLTVYEFNYDYIMSMKLFDAKVLVNTLLDYAFDMRLGLSIGLTNEKIIGIESVKEIVKNIIDSEDSELNDCFYTFNNSKYDALLQKTAEIKSKGWMKDSVNEISKILDEYNDNAELNEQIDVLSRAITQASVTVSKGVSDVDKTNLATAIVMSILSPKVLMLLEVNQQLMGGTWEKFSMTDLMKAMQNVIISIISEIRDLILQELLKLIIKQVGPIIATISSILVREQVENYADLIQDLIRNCPFIWFNFGNENQETKLETVDYADIDVSSKKENIQPTNNCK